MKIPLYQIIVSIIAIIMIFQGLMNYFKGKTGQTFLKLAVRVVVWGSMALIAVFPKFTNVLAEFIGLKGNINAVILTGFLLVFLFMFKLLSAIERLEQQVTGIIRKKSLEDIKKDN